MQLSLMNSKGLNIGCTGVLPKDMLLVVLMHSSETKVWNGEYRSRVQSLTMDNF